MCCLDKNLDLEQEKDKKKQQKDKGQKGQKKIKKKYKSTPYPMGGFVLTSHREGSVNVSHLIAMKKWFVLLELLGVFLKI